jgi:hypothetical protein
MAHLPLLIFFDVFEWDRSVAASTVAIDLIPALIHLHDKTFLRAEHLS